MVFISGATVSGSPSSHITQLWEQHHLEIAVSDLILTELSHVMKYPDIQRFLPFTDAQIARYVRKIWQGSHVVDGTTPVKLIYTDPKDNKFFACAVEAGASYLVSKDKRHILRIGSYMGVQTIHPQDFITQVMGLHKAA